MDRAQLAAYLEEGLSLADIGRRVGKDHSTIGYWVGKHGLEAAGKEKYGPRGGLGREELEPLVAAGASLAQIAAAVDRSTATVRHWLKKYGLRTTANPGAPARLGAREARAAGLAEGTVHCPRHGATGHIRDSRGSYRCRRCRVEGVVRRRQKVKRILVEEAGGRCRLCGYSRCVAALEFHHTDPSTKEFTLAQRGAHSIERLRAEVRKCVLLCANCHAEVEVGFTALSSDVSGNLPSPNDSDRGMS
ncbi:MAG: helix-turn-helix domain-containing protein [Solirubrobacterales bacterium]|nr:helix-turn-helix domain-containing protein [Solirubrobacterales bacterium]